MIIFVVIKQRICNWFHSRDLIISNVKRFGCYYYKKWNEYFSAKMKISLRIIRLGTYIHEYACMTLAYQFNVETWEVCLITSRYE